MIKNLKYQILIFLLLIGMVGCVFLATGIWVTNLDLVLKIIFTVASVLLTFCIFIGIRKLNMKLIHIEKKEKEEKIRCPKCYNDYDGVECLVCGYKKL